MKIENVEIGKTYWWNPKLMGGGGGEPSLVTVFAISMHDPAYPGDTMDALRPWVLWHRGHPASNLGPADGTSSCKWVNAAYLYDVAEPLPDTPDDLERWLEA